MKTSAILQCLRIKNKAKQTPLHSAAKIGQAAFLEAILDLNQKPDADFESTMDDLFGAKDENANTVLHLATQKNKLYQGKTIKSAQVLLSFLKIHTKCSQKILKLGNSFGWTPFSGAVAWGDLQLVEEMLEGLVEGEKGQIVNQADFSDTAPLHLAAKYGHVEIFEFSFKTKQDCFRKDATKRLCSTLQSTRSSEVLSKPLLMERGGKKRSRLYQHLIGTSRKLLGG